LEALRSTSKRNQSFHHICRHQVDIGSHIKPPSIAHFIIQLIKNTAQPITIARKGTETTKIEAMMVEDTRAGDVKVAAPATTGPASDHDLPKLGGNPSKSILIPGSPYPNIPEEEAWPIGRLLFTWMKPLFRRAATLHREGKALEYDDLIPLVTVDHSESLGVKFEDAWRKQAENEAKAASVAAESESEANNNSNKRTTNVTVEDLKNSKDFGTKKIQKAVSGVMGRRFVLAGAVKALNTSLQFSFPLLLNAILRFIEDTQNGVFDDSDPWYDRYRGYWLAALLFLVMGSKAITESKYFHMVNRSAFRAKAAISAAVYNKSLRLSSSERQSTTLGELVNLMQVDASKIEMFIPQVHVSFIARQKISFLQ
jgi:hypothetical protein